jgi:hypothetical protein
MVDIRIYRALLALVAFAVIVFAFSLQSQPRAVTTAPPSGQFFSGAYSTMKDTLASAYQDRAPGSEADRNLATFVEQQLSGHGSAAIHGFTVQTENYTAKTANGTQGLQNVVATSPGLGGGTIVVVSHRDATGSPATADLSGTAVLLGLASALSGETLNRSVMLVSTSGQIGAAGTTQLAGSLAGGAQHVDAVIVLGDLAGASARNPVVVPWSDTDKLAPPLLRNTLASFVTAETRIPVDTGGVGGQLTRLAFPFAVTEQAPFAASGIPAVLLSTDGDLPGLPSNRLAPRSQIGNLGTAVLQTVNALDTGPAVAAPTAYLMLSGKIVPLWAIRLLVLALILPVVATTLDALARTRRRGHMTLRWVGWVLVGAVPFLIGLGVLLLSRAAGWLSATPPGAVLGGSAGGRGIALSGADTAVLGLVVFLVVVTFVFARPLCLRALLHLSEADRRPESPAADAAAVALSVVMCLLALVMWAINPFAALLLVPALHLWLWLAQPSVRAHRLTVAMLLLVAIVPPILVAVYYLIAYDLSPINLLWSVVLMTGGSMPITTAIVWSVALGCLTSAVVISVRAVRAAVAIAESPVTMRGPSSYAGPGSLGGTESALRR